MLSLIVVVSGLLGRSLAYTDFKPDCSLPPPRTNFVSGPNIRGSLTILWNCLSIILLCTWNIQHLNVPAIRQQSTLPDESKRFDKLKSFFSEEMSGTIRELMVKCKWMLFTVFVPEYLVGKALCELGSSKASYFESFYPMRLGKKMFKDQVAVHMANMGYFVLDWDPRTDKPVMNTFEDQRAEEDPIIRLGKEEFDSELARCAEGLLQGEYHFVGGLYEADSGPHEESTHYFFLSESKRINISRLKSRYWALNADQWRALLLLTGTDLVDEPDPMSSQLRKLDRSGALVKALALLQSTYLVVQLICRKIAHLPSTQLEIAALAFAVCSMITYGLYWNRPQGVETVHLIKAKKLVAGSALRKLMVKVCEFGPLYIWLSYRSKTKFDSVVGAEPIPNDSVPIVGSFSGLSFVDGNDEIMLLTLGAFFGGSIFGSIHCLAWNFHFPTKGEALGWKICSIGTAILPPLMLAPLIVWMKMNPYIGEKRGSPLIRALVASIGLGGFLLPYLLARLYLLVEIFRTLCYLPPEAFVDTWSGSFPHFG